MDALNAKKKLIVVVNTTLMDNHQAELADAMSERHFVFQTTVKGLFHTLTLDFATRQPYPPVNPRAFSNLLVEELALIIETVSRTRGNKDRVRDHNVKNAMITSC